MVLVVANGDSARDAGRVIAIQERSVRSSVALQRAASLNAIAAVPLIVVVAFVIALVPIVLVFSLIAAAFHHPFLHLARRRAASLGLVVRRRRLRRDGSTAVRDKSGLAPDVQVVELPEWRQTAGVGFLRVFPLAIVALPAATASLWPGSLIWAAIIALSIVLAMRWARDSQVARGMRWLLQMAILLGLGHTLFGWPTWLPPVDGRLVAALGAAVVVVAVLAVLRRRKIPESRVGAGLLGARWLLLLVGFAILGTSSIALFLGSNGETSVGANVRSKLVALPGLVLVSIAARRLRAARSLAQRDQMRRHHRPEVLYLRSFADDGLRVRSKRRDRSGIERWLPWPTELFEDVLLRGFECIGPVDAIGRPGTSQTGLGAFRELVIGEDWLPAVKAEMDRARFITVVLGPGKGLSTELLTLRELGRLDRVCIVVPPIPASEVAERLAAATEAIDGEKAWGDITDHAIADLGEIVALVAIGKDRAVMVAKRRALASTYGALADRVCAQIAAKR
jgi:hypothetical protein